MRIPSFIKVAYLTTASVAVGIAGSSLPLVASPLESRAETGAREQAVTSELKNLRETMLKLKKDASNLESLARSSKLKESHAAQLMRVREHVNRIGVQIATVESMRPSAAPWQQQAIDNMKPIAIELAQSTTNAIHFLNQNSNQLWSPEYKEHVMNIPALSGQMHEVVDSHLDLADAQDRFDNVQAKLSEG